MFKQKSTFDLQFKKLNAGSNKVTITDDTGNSEVDVDVAEGNLTLASIGGTLGYARLNVANSIVNADISTSAAIAYSKLNLADSIGNADINTSAGIQYSKLTLTGSILNADVNASAGITYGKLSLTNGIVNADINSAAAIAYSKLNLATSIVNADVNASAAIGWGKVSKSGSLLDDLGDVTITSAVSGDVPTWNGTAWINQQPPGASGGEANTASNVGAAGVGVFKQKIGIDLEFKKINAGSSRVTITDDTSNSEVDVDIPATTVFTGQANTFGAFDQLFPSGRLLVGDSDASHSYLIKGSNLTANRDATLPLLTGNDVFVFADFTQVLKNKTLEDLTKVKNSTATSATRFDIYPSISTVADTTTRSTVRIWNNDDGTNNEYMDLKSEGTNGFVLAINKSGTGTVRDLVIRSGALESIRYYQQYDQWVHNSVEQFVHTKLYLRDSNAVNSYIFYGSALAASRNVTLPLLTGNDTFAFEAHTQTLTNKTIDAASNTLEGILINNQTRRTGIIYSANTTIQALGSLGGVATVGTVTGIIDSTEGNVTQFQTSSSGVNIGMIPSVSGNGGFTRADFNPVLRARVRMDDTSSSRLYFGFAAVSAIAITDTPLGSGEAGFLVGYNTATANWSIFHNDATGTMNTTTIGAGVAKNANWNTFEITATASTFTVTLNGGSSTPITTNIPAGSTNLYVYATGQTSAAVTRNFQNKYVYMRSDK